MILLSGDMFDKRPLRDFSIECWKCKAELNSRSASISQCMRSHKALTGHSLFRVVIYNEALPVREIDMKP